MRILHLALFTRNIVDNASHNGFCQMLKSNSKTTFEFEKLEIRKFYQSYNREDKHFFN